MGAFRCEWTVYSKEIYGTRSLWVYYFSFTKKRANSISDCLLQLVDEVRVHPVLDVLDGDLAQLDRRRRHLGALPQERVRQGSAQEHDRRGKLGLEADHGRGNLGAETGNESIKCAVNVTEIG